MTTIEPYSRSSGQVITFYSYKGGTGRSMALANIAYLLTRDRVGSDKVLMIDWDLEAPGLHQFYHGKFVNSKGKPSNLPGEQLGLIDLFNEMKARLEKGVPEEIPDQFFEDLNIEKYIAKLDIPSLLMMPAGRFDDGLYSSRVNAFDWEDFFNNYPLVIPRFADYLRKKYKYVLIDSRTGYTDISNICTSLMPEKLVVVFTPNRQSLTGIVELIRNATEYRKQSDDLRPLIVFPLPSRIDYAERDLRKEWRSGNPSEELDGYQSLLEAVIKDVYDLQDCDLTRYFDEIQLQYVPHYSYGEELAVLSERTEDRLTLARSYESFTERLIDIGSPWEKHFETLKTTKQEREKERAEREYNKSSSWLDRWAKQPVGVRAAIIAGILGVIGLLVNTLLDTWIDNRPTPTPTPILACISADDILVKFQVLRNGEMIATLSPSESVALESGWTVDFQVEISYIKNDPLPEFEYTWTSTGIAAGGELLNNASRIVDYRSGQDIVDDAISLQLNQPGCPALAPYPFLILPNKE